MKKRVCKIVSCLLAITLSCSIVFPFEYKEQIVNAGNHLHTAECYADSDTSKDPSCSKTVINIVPDEKTQKLKPGESINRSARVFYLDNHSEQVQCIVEGFNAFLYNTEQTVTFSYGDYSGDVEHNHPYSVDVKVTVDAFHKLSISTPDAKRGTVVGEEGLFLEGHSCQISASSNDGYDFKGWYSDNELISDNATYIFEMPNKDLSLTARFKRLVQLKVELNQLFHDTYDFEPYFNGAAYTIEENVVVLKPMIDVVAIYDDGTTKPLEPENYELTNSSILRYGTNQIVVSTVLNNKIVTGSAIVMGNSIEFTEYIDELMIDYGFEEADYANLSYILDDSLKQLKAYNTSFTEIIETIELTGLSDELETKLNQIYTEIARIYDRVNALELVFQETLGDEIDTFNAEAISDKILEIRRLIKEGTTLKNELETRLTLLTMTLEEKEELLLLLTTNVSEQLLRQTTLLEEKSTLRNNISLLYEKIEIITNEINEKNKIISSNETTISELEKSKGNNEVILAGYEEEKTITDQTINILTGDNDDLREQIALIEEQLRVINEENNKLLLKKQSINSSINTAKDEIDSLMINESSKSVVVDVVDLETLLKQLDNANKKLSNTNNILFD